MERQIAKILWSDNAKQNLKKIHSFIAEDSHVYATRFTKNLVRDTHVHLSQNNLGRNIPEFENTPLYYLKEIIYKGYRVIYNPQDFPTKITIISVLPGRMDLSKHIKGGWIID